MCKTEKTLSFVQHIHMLFLFRFKHILRICSAEYIVILDGDGDMSELPVKSMCDDSNSKGASTDFIVAPENSMWSKINIKFIEIDII